MKRRRRGDSEDESEELARARRERARRARAELARKAKGEEPDDSSEEADDSEKGESSESAAKADPDRARARERLAKAKATLDSSKPAKDDKPARGSKPEKLKSERKAAPEKKAKSDDEPERKARSAKDAKSSKKAKPEKDAESSKKAKSAKDAKPGKKSKPETSRRLRGSRPAKGGKDADSKGRKRGAGAKSAGKGALVALKDGARETRSRATKAAPKVGAGALGLLASAFAIFFTGLGYVLTFLIAVAKRVVPPTITALRVARKAVEAISRQATPVRVLALVVAGAAVLLALSQFADYRNISIGTDAYADGIQTVAPAPVRETAETGSAHSYLMIPLAVVALVLLGAALTGRWRLCRLIALAGLIAIAVGLIHDRPTGLDTGDLTVAYTGVKATLVGGFYAQLFSGLLLTLSSLLLGRELRLAGAHRPARAPRGSGARRKLLRRNQRVEGARA